MMNTNITFPDLVESLDFLINTYTARIEHAANLQSDMHKFLLLGSLKMTEAMRQANKIKDLPKQGG